ncbi:MAG: hypothetical protein AAGF30_00325 [Pseudomonadota bacterium]
MSTIPTVQDILFPNSEKPVIDRAALSLLLQSLVSRSLTEDDGAVIKTDGMIIGPDEDRTTIVSTAEATLTLDPIADLAGNFKFWVYATGGEVTLQPTSGETINSAATAIVPEGFSARLAVDDSGWQMSLFAPTADAGVVPVGRQIITGAGLLGGGTLSQDRTLSVDTSSDPDFAIDPTKLVNRGGILEFVRTVGPQMIGLVTFDGRAPVTVFEEFNISSVSRIGTGAWWCSFLNKPPNESYGVFPASDSKGITTQSFSGGVILDNGPESKTVDGFLLRYAQFGTVGQNGGARADPEKISCLVVRVPT